MSLDKFKLNKVTNTLVFVSVWFREEETEATGEYT